jgi:hypothetical protein
MIAMMAVAGALVGLGLFVLVNELRPAPPRLDAVLSRLDGLGPAADPSDLPAVSFTVQAAAARVAGRLAGPGGLPVPRADLELVGQSPQRFMLNKIGCALLGLAVPAGPSLLALASGTRLPLELPTFAALIAAAVLFFAPDAAVRVDAARRRAEFRRTLTSYLDLVALERAAGAAPNQALESAAEISQEWVFRRIAAALQRSRRAQEPPWLGLATLGDAVGVQELSDIAEIAELAAGEGAKILDTLMAKAESMRNQHLAEARTGANGATTTMVIPIALLGFGFLLLLAFPVLYRMAAI